ncbi:MAG: 50S ribosome-binding GTPase, partial [Chloroflexi bacterium]|nr:50S ribosome-binding GTPase [Chloroflexota bacterium]
APTRSALEAGLAQLAGSLSSRVGKVRQDLLQAAAHLEATIDFPEEEIPRAELDESLQRSTAELQHIASTASAGIVYRQGVRTAIAGRPNVGKSSLLNALLRFERAIVTNIPGTTRDTLEETLNLRGVPFVLVDTAGITASEDLVEQLGVERSRLAMASAALVVLVLDGNMPLSAQDRHVAELVHKLRPDDEGKSQSLIVVNKADLPQRIDLREAANLLPGAKFLRTSVVTGEGLQELEDSMLEMAFSGRIVSPSNVLVTSARHEQSLRAALDCLISASSAVNTGLTADAIAIDLRGAIDALGKITGETVGEDILDRIFSDFCIGK